MIKVLFVSNNKPGALSIRWGTKRKGQKMKDTPSHVVFQFDDEYIDSTLNSGVSKKTKEDVFSHYKLVKEVDLHASPEETEKYLQLIESEIEGSEYDSFAIIFFTLCVIRKKTLGIPYPDKNKFNVKNKWFCSELYEIISGKPEGMTDPNSLMYLLSSKGFGGK